MKAKEGIDLTEIYTLRNKFTIIGLTGRTGSGCSHVADLLKMGYTEKYPLVDSNTIEHNSYRKYRIVQTYCKENFKSYEVIAYKHILVLFLLKEKFKKLEEFLVAEQLRLSFEKSGLKTKFDFSKEIEALNSLKSDFEKDHQKLVNID